MLLWPPSTALKSIMGHALTAGETCNQTKRDREIREREIRVSGLLGHVRAKIVNE